ncbi:Endonuclease containing a URI domain [Shewanella amazonensis]|uniref:Endonuclease containing a URI domain n=1 Tax=Shewanella amazonensis (strain ATCC BAA-1098 / SB2B) TaxID=326297 RepID=A1S1V1_SHEAM|nr:endonuclease containing a URI domain [Shewanella amazonensis SB2B]
MSPIWQLYIIRCATGELYTGVTTNVARRFDEHQCGGARAAKYLRGRGPLTLVYQENVGSRGDALRRELAVKKLSKAAKEALISPVAPGNPAPGKLSNPKKAVEVFG